MVQNVRWCDSRVYSVITSSYEPCDAVITQLILRKKIIFDNKPGEELKIGIRLGSVKFDSLCHIFRDHSLRMSLKREGPLFDQCITPLSYHYGAETTTKRLERKLRVTERAMKRIMIGVTKTDRVTKMGS